eukprot:scaffold118560_cov60-Phaeocystis_antarctica.AAC.2
MPPGRRSRSAPRNCGVRDLRRSARVLQSVASVRDGDGRAEPHQASSRLRGSVVADIDSDNAVERGLDRPVVSGRGGVYMHGSCHVRPLLGCSCDLRKQRVVHITRLDVPIAKRQGESGEVGAGARADFEQPACAAREVAAQRFDRALVGQRAHPA